MGKALIIKDADFYNNRVGVVDYADVPCTGITLDKETAQVSTTLELIASVTPINTTDVIVWTSSDDSVASVENGIVTAFSSGTATITATCGEYSANCIVTVVIAYKASKEGIITVNPSSGNVLLEPCACTIATQFGSIGSFDGKYPCVGSTAYSSLGDILDIYPIKLPTGVSKVNVSCSSDIATLIVYYNADQKVSNDYQTFRDCAKVVDGQTPIGGTPWSISAWEFGNKSYVIPQVEGLNSFTIGLRFKTSSAYNAFDVNNPGIIISFE